MMEDDEPWADPQIKLNYEKALGSFLVRFNRIENAISSIIYQALHKLGRDDLVERCQNQPLSRRLETLELILLAHPGSPTPDNKRIMDLAGHRNNLAHGHFDQNPFDGSYAIVGKKRSVDYSAEKVRELGVEADAIWEHLRDVEVNFWFDDLDAEN